MCKHENDPGEEVQCQELEESASCMSAILRKLIEWFLFVDVLAACIRKKPTVIMPIFTFQYLPTQNMYPLYVWMYFYYTYSLEMT